jgi:alcohol dehydrogenase
MITHFTPFSIARLPRIEFGRGKAAEIADAVNAYGQNVLLVTGESSFIESELSDTLSRQFDKRRIHTEHVRIGGEPSPQMIDKAVHDYRHLDIEVVLGIGGGSALDAAKAIAGLLRVKHSVLDFLESVGPELPYQGPTVPLILAPTTAGTGSEATKNAVLSKQGRDGFKKSFRDEQLVADIAIVDPDLLASCPAEVIAANGMDALTQLIESYVSTKANVFTDALGISALRAARDGLLPLYASDGGDADARDRMAYASLISGINLAQTGLGSVHGLASPLGAFHPIPHGVVCGTLVASATATNIAAMQMREPDNPALARYARVSEVLWQQRFSSSAEALDKLVELLRDWTRQLHLKKLAAFGLDESALDHVVKHSRGSSMKTNPIVLTDAEIRAVLVERL